LGLGCLAGCNAGRQTAGSPPLLAPVRNDKIFKTITMTPTFTIGIEEEYQTIDPETRDLRSHIQAELLEKGRMVLQERVKAELHQSVVEVGTGICKNIKEAKDEVKELRRHIIRLARENGLRVASVATHPFADWKVQEIYPDDRYKNIVEDMQLVARANLIFGLHVHIGIEDRETAIHMMNHARYFLPHILALSTNSPFWLGMNTGLKSYRCKVFDKFPRTNIPDYFPSWGEYENFIKLLIKTNCIDNAKKIWWDIRPHPFFNTIEFRVCDIPMRADETIALAALIQATVAKLYKLYSANQGFRLYRRALIMENKWRAARYGLEGKLIDFGKQKEVPARELVNEYLDFVDDVVDELGSREELNYIRKIVETGSGADRQLRVFKETGDLKKVVDYIVEETAAGLEEEPTAVRKVG
jgi:glutamate---cysteine ligase / carboxylate-amine ligase